MNTSKLWLRKLSHQFRHFSRLKLARILKMIISKIRWLGLGSRCKNRFQKWMTTLIGMIFRIYCRCLVSMLERLDRDCWTWVKVLLVLLFLRSKVQIIMCQQLVMTILYLARRALKVYHQLLFRKIHKENKKKMMESNLLLNKSILILKQL